MAFLDVFPISQGHTIVVPKNHYQNIEEIPDNELSELFKIVKKLGFETVGFFMFGLPGETEKTMKETIKFAKKLSPDYAKVTILVPFPSTPIYAEMESKGLIKTKDWSKYNFHTPSKVYKHENLDWLTLEKYYSLFYRQFYFRPGYITKRIAKGILSGRIFSDVYYFIKTWII